MFRSFAALLLLKFACFNASMIISYSASMLAAFNVVSSSTVLENTGGDATGTVCTTVAAGSVLFSKESLLKLEISNGNALSSIYSPSVSRQDRFTTFFNSLRLPYQI